MSLSDPLVPALHWAGTSTHLDVLQCTGRCLIPQPTLFAWHWRTPRRKGCRRRAFGPAVAAAASWPIRLEPAQQGLVHIGEVVVVRIAVVVIVRSAPAGRPVAAGWRCSDSLPPLALPISAAGDGELRP